MKYAIHIPLHLNARNHMQATLLRDAFKLVMNRRESMLSAMKSASGSTQYTEFVMEKDDWSTWGEDTFDYYAPARIMLAVETDDDININGSMMLDIAFVVDHMTRMLGDAVQRGDVMLVTDYADWSERWQTWLVVKGDTNAYKV